MNDEIRHLVQRVHDSPGRTMMVAAGAGAQALSDLLGVAGATRTLLEALIPYNSAAFDEFLGQTPGKYVQGTTARLLAGRALTRARHLETEEAPVVGWACTATIVTDRPKRGQHRAYVATWQPQRLTCHALFLEKGARNRLEEEEVVSHVMLNALAAAIGLSDRLALPLREADDYHVTQFDFASMARRLLANNLAYFSIGDNGRIGATTARPQVLLPGAFNPLHQGHLGLACAAAEMLGQPVAFEITAVNVDKPPLATDSLLARMSQFAGRYPVFATTAPTFVEKARLFPGATFVVGYDTAERMLHPGYYGDDTAKMEAALANIHALGCSFLVAGRVDENGRFRHLSDLPIPTPFTPLFQAIPEHRFREDISSTKIRAQRRQND